MSEAITALWGITHNPYESVSNQDFIAKVAFAFYQAEGEAGREDWLKWVEPFKPNTKKSELLETWKSARKPGEVKAETLFWLAKECGNQVESGHERQPRPVKEAPPEERSNQWMERWEKAKPADKARGYLAKDFRCDFDDIRYEEDVDFESGEVTYTALYRLTSLSGEHTGTMSISPNGAKKLILGSRKEASSFRFGNWDKPEVVLLAEGYRNSNVGYRASGHAMACTNDAGHAKKVAAAVREEFPDALIIFLSDDDKHKVVNTGVETGKEIATLFGGDYVMPHKIGVPNKAGVKTDFVDFYIERGLPEVEKTIKAVVDACKRSAREKDANGLQPIRAITLPPSLERIKNCFKESAKYPDEGFAALMAILFGGQVISRHYIGPTGLGSNMYVGAIGHTGFGKDVYLSLMMQLGRECGLFIDDNSGEIRYEIQKTFFASEPALHEQLVETPSMLAAVDELGKLLAANARSGDSWHAKLIRYMLSLFSSTQEVRFDRMTKAKSGPMPPVCCPSFSMLGFMTEQHLSGIVNDESLGEGLVNRCMIVPLMKDAEKNMGRFESRTIPPEVAEDVRWIRDTARKNVVWKPAIGSFVKVLWGTGAAQAWARLDDEQDKLTETTDPLLSACAGRILENALKVAAVITVFQARDTKKDTEGYVSFLLEEKTLVEAYSFVESIVLRFVEYVRKTNVLNEGSDQAYLEKVMAFARKRPHFTLNDLVKNVTKFDRLPIQRRDAILNDLMRSGQIERSSKHKRRFFIPEGA